MRFPYRVIWLAGVFVTGLATAATSTGRSAAATVDQYLAGLTTWSADFTQTVDDGAGKTLRTASGHLFLQRPGKFRWDYRQPVEQLVLADGRQLWFYDKDLAQANVRDFDGSLANTPATLLAGTSSLALQFDITALPGSEGLEWFQLRPRKADTDFQAIRVAFARGELVRMLLADKLNQVTSLKFTGAKRNVPLAPELFSFLPPAGVDVIGRAVP